MKDFEVNLFFDESGKGKDQCKLMGGVLIPKNIYEFKDFQDLNKELKSDNYKLHFTDYNKLDKEKYINAIRVLCKYQSFCDMLVINYRNPEGNYDKDSVKDMFYRKLPERIFYGMLRHNGKHINVKADLFIEEAKEYVHKIKLHESIVTTLNEQALYRGEKFIIKSFQYKHKNEEIGVELTDLLLGVIRNIMIYNVSENTGKGTLEKIKLIKEFFKIPGFKEFLSKAKLYEWNNCESLKVVMFDKYINLFISMNDDLIEYQIKNKGIVEESLTISDCKML